jgi:hypothetical protein
MSKLLFIVVCIIVGAVLCWFGFNGAPDGSLLTTIDQLETQETVFVKSKGKKLDVTVSDEVLTGIEGYKKQFLGKLYLYQITLGDQSTIVVCGNQLLEGITLRFPGMVVSRTANQALNNLISEYEAQHPDVSVAQQVILFQHNPYMIIGVLLLLVALFSLRGLMKKITMHDEYV